MASGKPPRSLKQNSIKDYLRIHTQKSRLLLSGWCLAEVQARSALPRPQRRSLLTNQFSIASADDRGAKFVFRLNTSNATLTLKTLSPQSLCANFLPSWTMRGMALLNKLQLLFSLHEIPQKRPCLRFRECSLAVQRSTWCAAPPPRADWSRGATLATDLQKPLQPPLEHRSAKAFHTCQVVNSKTPNFSKLGNRLQGIISLRDMSTAAVSAFYEFDEVLHQVRSVDLFCSFPLKIVCFQSSGGCFSKTVVTCLSVIKLPAKNTGTHQCFCQKMSVISEKLSVFFQNISDFYLSLAKTLVST